MGEQSKKGGRLNVTIDLSENTDFQELKKLLQIAGEQLEELSMTLKEIEQLQTKLS